MRRVLPVIVAAAAACLLAACETTPVAGPPIAARPAPPPPPPPTPAEEFAWSTGRGPNTLTVVINYQPGAGQVWSCAGMNEALMPETSYSRGRIQALYGSSERAVRTVSEVQARSRANTGPTFAEFVRQQLCDGANSVTFRDLPNGAYFVIVPVRQTRPGGAPQVVVMQRIELRGGETVRVVLPQGGSSPRAAAAPSGPPRRTR